MRTYCISDIHGMYDEFCDLLELISFSPGEDRLFLLGDYIDRGPKSKQVVQKVRELVERQQAVAIRGNHDEMFLEFLDEEDPKKIDRFLRNGGKATIKSCLGKDWFAQEADEDFLEKTRRALTERFPEDIAFIRQLPYFHETDTQIFVHAGINPACDDWKETPSSEMIWIRDAFYHQPTRQSRTVIFGHTTCDTLHEKPEVWFGEGKIGIDGGCTFGCQLNCLEILPDGYQVHFVPTRNKEHLEDKQA